MKTLKKLANVFLAAMMCFAMFAFASCGGDKNKSTPPTAYEFTIVYENGGPATGVYVQLCTIDEKTGELGMCYAPVYADSNSKGKVTYNPNGFPGVGVYEIHLLGNDMQPLNFEGESMTKAKYERFTLTIVTE